MVAVGESGVTIRCGDGAVQIESVRPDGEERVAAADWAGAAGVDESSVCGA